MPSLGIDYNSRVACWGYVEGDKLVASGSLDFSTDLQTSLRTFQTLLLSLQSGQPMKVYIEQPLALTAALPMAMMASRLQTAALLAGFEVELPAPSTWRKVVLGHGMPKNPKQLAVDYVVNTFGWEPPSLLKKRYEPDHNRCEAICIAVYGESR